MAAPAPTPTRLLVAAFVLFLLGQVPVAAVVWQGERLSGRLLLATCCASVVIAGLLTYLVRQQAGPRPFLGAVLWPLITGAVAYLTMALYVPEIILLSIGIRLALAVAILSFFLDRLMGFFEALTASTSHAAVIVLLLLGLTTLAPLWLAPWVEYLAAHQLVTELVIGGSPFTYLTIMADLDYLRSQWFYRNTPFGGLRYSYPGQLVSSTVYLSLGLLLWLGERGKRGRLTTTTTIPADLEEQRR